jgi:type I restriction enzyme M protein
VLFINASKHFEKGKRQTRLRDGKHGEPDDIEKIVSTYQCRKEETRYARRVSMAEVEKNDFNLNISRYVSTAKAEDKIDLQAINAQLQDIKNNAVKAVKAHNQFLQALGLPTLPE